MKVVIVGAGFGGLKLARRLNNKAGFEVVLVDRFNYHQFQPLFYQVATAGLDASNISFPLRKVFHKTNNVRIRLAELQQVVAAENKIITDTEEISYDVLVIATGADTNFFGNTQMEENAFPMKSTVEALQLRYRLLQNFENALTVTDKAELQRRMNFVIVGGGLLGLELAASLRDIQVNVAVIQRENRLMTRQLDEVASELLHQELTDRGIELFYQENIRYFVGEGVVEGVHLSNGQTIPAQAVVFAIGTQPNTELARAAGLSVNRGVCVNEYLQTSDPAIFAAGEVAELNGQMWGITAAAEEQADTIARYLNGDRLSYYTGSLSMNILKMDGLHLCSLGLPVIPAGATDYEEVVFIDRAKRYYKKCIIHRDRLVGAILMGDKNEFLEYKELIHQKTELSEKRLSLLRSGRKRRRPSIVS